MPYRRLISILALVTTLLLLPGCVYLRLLSFKNQLHDFDEKVQVDTIDGLALQFPDPVVRDEDFVFITESPPTAIHPLSAEPKRERWDWTFQKKLNAKDPEPFSIVFRTHFEDNLLTHIAFDPKLLEAIPAEFMVEVFRSLGQARISKLRKSATASMTRDSLESVELPSIEEISSVMGPPTQKKGKGQRARWSYVFRFYNPENQELSGRFRIDFLTDSPDHDHEIAGFELTAKAR